MEPDKQQVATERDELNVRLQKLTAFIWDGNAKYAGLPDREKLRLRRQLSYMTDYSNVLDMRLADWGPDPET